MLRAGDDIACRKTVRPFVKECCGLFVPFAVFHGRTALGLPENTGQVPGIIQPEPACHIRDRLIGREKLLCKQVHPHGGYVLVDALSGGLAETDFKKPP